MERAGALGAGFSHTSAQRASISKGGLSLQQQSCFWLLHTLSLWVLSCCARFMIQLTQLPSQTKRASQHANISAQSVCPISGWQQTLAQHTPNPAGVTCQGWGGARGWRRSRTHEPAAGPDSESPHSLAAGKILSQQQTAKITCRGWGGAQGWRSSRAREPAAWRGRPKSAATARGAGWLGCPLWPVPAHVMPSQHPVLRRWIRTRGRS